MESQDIKPFDPKNEELIENKNLSLLEALLPIFLLIGILGYNVYAYGDSATSGPNQFALIIGAAIAAIVGFRNKVSYSAMMEDISKNVKSTSGAILILLMVGALSGTWLLSGVIPTMIYYGLQILHPAIFLPACVIICSVISIATGSSWTTSATVGIALIGIGSTIGMPLGMVAGAVVSGAYFGDKLSPLSDTTNLAPAMAGTDLFTHIRYMTLTTVPTMVLTLIIFIFLGLAQTTSGGSDTAETLTSIKETFNISPWLFLVPGVVILLIIKKTEPLIALLIGTLLGGLFALFFQPELVAKIGGSDKLSFISGYKGVMNAITVETSIETTNEMLSNLFSSKGMKGMLGTIWLILCAMVFGGVMEAIGALTRITDSLLKLFHTTFGLFASTVASCLALNLTASDQYLAIVVPGKMFSKAYADKGLAPENLSRTLEDSGTVTSVLIPWNTCGAYQAGVLGVSTWAYLPYAFFNIISPFMTLLFAAFNIKIKQLTSK
ncbi:MAG TPA: Na+/H+ antiporter NhaC [Flavobacterium sp.]|uniref:Na+/H+ antiporter NhaC n=1 Tax=unclassified Flavobacterium TaxID=196869 RepID=UPI000E99D6A8|nr:MULTISPECIES: Na+/H+ antiporter NhaC [unclassified Flavobacterium]HBI02296.1 Na+/H+ antiporter NhaC [Flavobacterium sp.]HRE78772.1 Na+/H+ antiporter NhaC [Flavobacterium sp.]